MSEDSHFSLVPSVTPFVQSEKFISLIVGPVGSTKTTAGIAKIAYHASKMAPCKDGIRRSRAIWIRNTREQLRDTSIPDFLKWYPDGVFGVFMKTEYKFVLKFDDVECEVLFRGLDDSNDVRRLLSLQASFAVMDEFREIHPDIYNAVQGRLGRYPDKKLVPPKPEWGVDDKGIPVGGCVDDSGKNNAHLWGMTNPPDADTFWEDLISNPPENLHVTIQPSGLSPEADWGWCLPNGYYDNLAAGKTEDWIDVYIHAKFGKSLAGKPVFRSFNRDLHLAKVALTPNRHSTNPVIVGFDCTGLNPAAVIGQLGFGGSLYIFDSLSALDKGPIRFIREDLKPLLANKYYGCKILVVIDPAGMARQADERNVADMLRAEGMVCKPARTNGIAARISAVETFLTRMSDGKAAFQVDPGCKDLVLGFVSRYRYKMNTKGEVADTPEKNHPYADIHDALQYLCLHADGGTLFGATLSRNRREVHAVSAAGWT